MLILASASPRRLELIKKITLDFKAVKSGYNEVLKDIPPAEYAADCALNKAQEVFKRTGGTVLGADTIVVFKNEILTKPSSKQDAFKMLSLLSNSTHSVITGVCIITEGKTITGCETSSVTFGKLSESDIEEYIETGSPLDKAGAYGLQDEFIKSRTISVKGSKDNIIGLPTRLVKKMIKENGIAI